MKKTILLLSLLLSSIHLEAQVQVPATTPWSRAFLKQTGPGNGVTFVGGTNFFADISQGGATVNMTGNATLVALTNSIPGEASYLFTPSDGANHVFAYPTAFHVVAGAGLTSSTITTNNCVIVTNGFVLNVVVRALQSGVANPSATNTVIWLGESGN